MSRQVDWAAQDPCVAFKEARKRTHVPLASYGTGNMVIKELDITPGSQSLNPQHHRNKWVPAHTVIKEWKGVEEEPYKVGGALDVEIGSTEEMNGSMYQGAPVIYLED